MTSSEKGLVLQDLREPVADPGALLPVSSGRNRVPPPGTERGTGSAPAIPASGREARRNGRGGNPFRGTLGAPPAGIATAWRARTRAAPPRALLSVAVRAPSPLRARRRGSPPPRRRPRP